MLIQFLASNVVKLCECHHVHLMLLTDLLCVWEGIILGGVQLCMGEEVLCGGILCCTHDASTVKFYLCLHCVAVAKNILPVGYID